ncbi:MAG: hypothetical protein U0694_24490 [Anaerolineae bacterium]
MMVAIRLKTTIGADRKLVVQLPNDIPPGSIELIVHSGESEPEVYHSAREVARAKLLAAGALVTSFETPPDAIRLSVEERLRLGTLPPDARSSFDLIDEDRGDW